MDAQVQGHFDNSHAAMQQAYQQYSGELYRYALMILADHSDAEDAVQQTFTKIMKTGKQHQIESYNGYLRTAVRNECYEIIRKRERLDGLANVLPSQPLLEKIDNGPPDEEQHVSIEKAIRLLPPEQREVLHMKIYEDRTFQEIAGLLGISQNTAASRYRYAMDKLREVIIPIDQ